MDQIEDHPDLENDLKVGLLRALSSCLEQGPYENTDPMVRAILVGHESLLEDVTLRMGEWADLAPAMIILRIWDATASVAERMAYWAERKWEIHSKADLDHYAFGVSGTTAILLSDLWSWHDGTQTNRTHAIAFGRGLQAVNILSNRHEDTARGVDFFPDGWSPYDMHAYARSNLFIADEYVGSMSDSPALTFCKTILDHAHSQLSVAALECDR